MQPNPPTSTPAVISLVFGILAWLALPIIGSIVAVVAGHIARGNIRANPHLESGDGLALAGLILGWIQLALCALIFLIVVLGVIVALVFAV